MGRLGDDRLDGGDGDDALRGGDGADVLDGEAGADVMRGGGGLDTVTYASRTAPVHVTVGVDEGDDGEEDEADTVSSDIEIVRGGRGNDELVGGPGPEELYGRAGDDILDGGDGAGDLLDGGDGDDELTDDDRSGRQGLLRRRDRPLQRRHPGPDRRVRTALRDRGRAHDRRTVLAAAALAAATLVPAAQAAKPRADLTISKAAPARARSPPAAS